jgi:RNA polymerase sigma factor for flagellar operon FliA
MRRLPASVDKADLVQVGLIAVAHAAASFRMPAMCKDVEAEQAFIGYARKRVRGAMLDELRQLDPLTRDQRRKVKAIQSARREWLQTCGVPPTLAEVAQRCGLCVEEASRLEAVANLVVDANPGHTLEFPSDPRWHLEGNESDLESRVDHEIIVKRLAGLWNHLPDKDRLVIDAYLGEGPSPVQLAHQMRVSVARVSQWHRGAIENIARLVGTRGRASSASFTRT